MCDNCKEVLGKCVKAHDAKSCPLKKGSYCTFCSAYGHSTKRCTKDSSYRRLEVHEDSYEMPTVKYILDYVDEPKAIRSLLKAYDELPRKEERNKDKYKNQLIKMAKKRNLVLVPHILEKNDITNGLNINS
jgi:hypothetical protein